MFQNALTFVTDPAVLYWLVGFSVIMFFVTLFGIPIIVSQIPEDYFLHKRKTIHTQHLITRIVVSVIKNIIGLVLLVGGFIMIFLPIPIGAAAIMMGIFIMDFPGKKRLERIIVRNKKIFATINWMRKKARKKPLIIPTTSNSKKGQSPK